MILFGCLSAVSINECWIFLHVSLTISLLILRTDRPTDFFIPPDSFILLVIPSTLNALIHVAVSKLGHDYPFDLDKIKWCWRVLVQLTKSVLQITSSISDTYYVLKSRKSQLLRDYNTHLYRLL